MGSVAARVLRDAQALVELQIEIARNEVKDLARRNAMAAGMITIGAILLALGLLVSLPLALVLTAHDPAIAALAWTAAYIAAGAILAAIGRSLVRLSPDKTIQSLKENKEWAKQQLTSIR